MSIGGKTEAVSGLSVGGGPTDFHRWQGIFG
jgi:hypothetical protein